MSTEQLRLFQPPNSKVIFIKNLRHNLSAEDYVSKTQVFYYYPYHSC
jgi:hypothetical protein